MSNQSKLPPDQITQKLGERDEAEVYALSGFGSGTWSSRRDTGIGARSGSIGYQAEIQTQL